MHHILSEKNERKMLFYLTFAAHCVRHFISSVQSGKLTDGTRATRENRKSGKSGSPLRATHIISAPKVAYLLNFYPEFPVFFLVNGKRPLRSHDVHVLKLGGADRTLFVCNGGIQLSIIIFLCAASP